jgi:hypothetical protein
MLELSEDSEQENVGKVERIHQDELRTPEKRHDVCESAIEPPPIPEGMLCLGRSGEQYNKIRGRHRLSAPFLLEHDPKLQVDKPVKYMVSITRPLT